jgi:hypothetical protein
MNLPSAKQIWSVVGAFVVISGIIAGGWALEDHFTPREIHKVTTDQIYADMSQFQKDLAVQRAMDAVMYWRRVEWELQNACDRYPNDRNLRMKLQRAREERQRAERMLIDIQRRR